MLGIRHLDGYTLPSLWPILNSSQRNVVIVDVVIVEVNALTVVVIVGVVVLSVVVVEVVLFVALAFGVMAFVMFAIVVSVTIKVALIRPSICQILSGVVSIKCGSDPVRTKHRLTPTHVIYRGTCKGIYP